MRVASCPTCDGDGVVNSLDFPWSLDATLTEECPDCEGLRLDLPKDNP